VRTDAACSWEPWSRERLQIRSHECVRAIGTRGCDERVDAAAILAKIFDGRRRGTELSEPSCSAHSAKPFVGGRLLFGGQRGALIGLLRGALRFAVDPLHRAQAQIEERPNARDPRGTAGGRGDAWKTAEHLRGCDLGKRFSVFFDPCREQVTGATA